MNVDELECHLTELISKEMDVRGVLRKLILEHCRLGNSKRIIELQEKFQEYGYKESPGINGALLQTYIQSGHLDLALDTYKNMKEKNKKFDIDEFKIINLATLLVKNNRFDEAMNIIKQEGSSR